MSKALTAIKQSIQKTEPMFKQLFGDSHRQRFVNESYYTIEACRKSAPLMKCTPESIRESVMSVINMGLTLNPSLGYAYLVPYGDECKIIVGYQGLCTLAYRSGLISSINCGVVHKGDSFDFCLGDEGYIKHRVHPETDEDSEDLLFVWVAIHTKNDGNVLVVKNKKWIDRRKAASKSADKSFSPWNPWYVEMGKKTVLRNGLKMVPKSPELENAIFLNDSNFGPDFSEPEEVKVEIMADDAVPKGTPEPQTA